MSCNHEQRLSHNTKTPNDRSITLQTLHSLFTTTPAELLFTTMTDTLSPRSHTNEL